MEATLREARLRAEFAHLYPTLQPGAWERATTMVLKVVEASLGRQRPSGSGERILRTGSDSTRQRSA